MGKRSKVSASQQMMYIFKSLGSISPMVSSWPVSGSVEWRCRKSLSMWSSQSGWLILKGLLGWKKSRGPASSVMSSMV